MSDERKMVDETETETVEQDLDPENPEMLGDPAIHEGKGLTPEFGGESSVDNDGESK
jgi:hypothetical protein